MKHFHTIPDYPKQVTPGTILTRLIDGLGFRFYWATEGLSEKEYKFRPSPDCMSIKELIGHIWGLVNWVNISVTDKKYKRPEEAAKRRDQVIEMLFDLRNVFIKMSDEEISNVIIEERPVWHIINGPISDALTHVGQINSFRRLAGNPVSKANVFTGTPPSE